jgi:hypothetical protein
MNRMTGVISLLIILHASALFAQLPADTPGTGTIAGRVTDAQNQPIAGIRVLLFKETIRHGYDPSKTRTGISDSAGRYEFRNVQEGDYWVAAEPDVQSDPSGRVMRFYFPETMLGTEAYILRVGPNAVLTAIDIRCVPVKQGFEAKGRVVESGTRKPLTNTRLTYGQINNGSVRQDVHTDQQGFFVITRLDPGRYWVAISHEQSEHYYCYPAYFEITTADVSELQIPVYKGVSLKGRIVLSKGIPETLFSELNVVFHPNGISEVNQHPTNYLIDRYMEKSSPVSVDGNFVLKGLPPLIGKLSLQKRAGLPLENYFVRTEQNGTNLSNALRIWDRDVDGITMQVTAGTGKIQGKVKAVNAIVELRRIRILISLKNATVSTFAKSMPLEGNGGFSFDGLLPGEYQVMAAISLENGMSRRSGDVYTVQLREAETQEIEILLNEK